MRLIEIGALIALALFSAHAPCTAHGIDASVGEGGVYVKIFYDDGTPVSFADVRVYTPAGREFISGITDRNGVFLFVPDAAGEWRVEADDGMGHRILKSIEVAGGYEYELAQRKPGRKFPRLYGAVTGVSLIFGFFGLFAMFSRRRKK